MESKAKNAVEIFDSGFNCCQASLLAFAEDHGLGKVDALKVAAGFGGGMGHMGQVCGALTGIFMALGLKYACIDPKDKAQKMKVYKIVKKAGQMFQDRNGAITCKDLLGFDLSTEKGQQQAKKPGSFDKCSDLVASAVEIFEEITR